MKKLFLIMMAGLMVVACATLTPAEKAELTKKVNAALDDRHYTINIRTMSPMRGPTRTVTNPWTVEVKGDTLVSYLPYIGRAYNVPYGGGKGLNFSAPIADYQETVGAKNIRHIRLTVNNDEDSYLYTFAVYDNGNTSIDIQSKERDAISFSGDMVVE